MYIESLTIRNFKCFGDKSTKISFSPGLTGFVGDNGSGKTAALEALKRLFSPESNERKIKRSDVHFGVGEDSNSVSKREIAIDVVFAFPDENGIPHVFNDLFFSASDRSLKVRLALEGDYVKSESYEDDIEVKLYTIRTLDEIPFGPNDERKIPIPSRGRLTQFAKLVYIPAHRDSLGVTRHALKNILKLIERSADWDEYTKRKSHEFAKQLEESLNAVAAVRTVSDGLKEIWRNLHDGHYDANPRISVVATEFEQLIRDLTLRFKKSPGGGQRQLEELSEGQVSLLYFALSATLHNLNRKIEAEASKYGFKPLDLIPPPLTIFALEEPESHLAPFYLPRLIGLLEKLIKEGATQSFVTSHSPSVLARIPPENVRYFRNCKKDLISDVREILLPTEEMHASFLHQVILANPEIYFARLVIIGEGNSERIIIPRIAEALGVPLDPSFVAFVPIGGRHAQHLWKLVKGLNIPCITLLDFDLGRHNGGMGRIEDAATWLKNAGVKHPIEPSNIISNEELNLENIKEATHCLRLHGVFYSTYLDIDMMMMKKFPEAYVPNKAFDETIDESKKKKNAISVFGGSGLGNDDLNRIGESFSDEELFIYKKLFKSRSKLASHFEALSKLDDEKIRENCPEPLKALIEMAESLLAPLPPTTPEVEE